MMRVTPVCRSPRLSWREGHITHADRALPEETAIAFTYDGGSYAVMMATPDDLEDFAVGFSLTEGIVASLTEIDSIDIIEEELGIELRMRLASHRSTAFRDRRRHLAGPTGCGLCGVETLAEAMRPSAKVGAGRAVSAEEIMQSVAAAEQVQALHQTTRAVHAAAYWQAERGLLAVREDVGRHNALDKLAGALARLELAPSGGLIVLTSRVSIEMVQKAAAIAAPVIVAVSAPTGLAVRTAAACGITLVAVARTDGFEVFTHPQRILLKAHAHVA
jgi:FdhD protein